uniref:Uncharacterized protein n=1 Tax=Chrysotila carterae TaxID=13221 RepID=A0A7S4EY03_CHRCT
MSSSFTAMKSLVKSSSRHTDRYASAISARFTCFCCHHRFSGSTQSPQSSASKRETSDNQSDWRISLGRARSSGEIWSIESITSRHSRGIASGHAYSSRSTAHTCATPARAGRERRGEKEGGRRRGWV